MAPGRRSGGGVPGGNNNQQQRKPQVNNHSRKSRGAAAAAAASSTGSSKKSTIKSLANVYSIDDEEESKSARRRKQYLDEVDNYEYNVDDIEDEDDEEIDSDEAFDEEDEEKYENFQFYGSKDQQGKKKNKKQSQTDKKDKGKGKQSVSDDEDMMDQDESEDEEEESEEEEGAEYMDISEMLDQPEEDEVPLPKKAKVPGFNDFDSEEENLKFGGESDDDEDDEDEDDEDEEMEEDNHDDETKTTNLTSFIDSLETKSSKRKQDDSTGSFSKKARKALRERTEAYDESEYNLQAHRSAVAHSANGVSNKKKLDMLDLVNSLQDEAGFSGLKKNIQALESGPKKGKAVETLAAPLPKIVQDRLNRQAAYEEAKKEVTKWLPIVQKNRQAEHLAFPMNAPPVEAPSSSTLASKFNASTAMEKEIQEVLIEGGMQEKKLMEFEELALNKMTTEEVEKRRADLRMMRDLMFREELRAKRVSKIKSKLYHKIKKRERERNALTTEEMKELDPQQAREEHMLQEQKRAQERMTLKHKNTGKWAKDQLKHGNFDPESRQAITEQIERGERLRRKIQDVDSDEEDSGGESEYSDFDDDDIEGVKARAFDELAQVEEQLAKDQDAALEAKVGKGVFAMKFMQDAAKRSKMQAQIAAEEFRKEMMEEDELRAQSSEDEWKSVSKGSKKAAKKAAKEAEAGTAIGTSGGRMVFGNADATPVQGDKAIIAAPEKAVKMNSAGQISKVALSGGHSTKVAGPVNVKIAGSSLKSTAQDGNDSNGQSANPWLETDKHGQGKIARKGDKGMKKDSSKADKLQGRLKKQKAAEAGSDDEVQIDTSSYLTLSKDNQKEHGLNKDSDSSDSDESEEESMPSEPVAAASKKSNKKVTKATTSAVSATVGSGDEDDSDASEAEPVMVHAKTAAALSQRDLVARAFANDNVVSEFEKEKMEVMEAEKPKDVDLTLPGWGSWGGKGAKKKKNVVVKKAQPGEGIEASKRKDAKLAHVIINERRDKKAAAYAVTRIPHPFKTWEQYEQSLRAPVGKEWNTNSTFQKMTLPRITTKLGKIIDPLTAPFK
ncbi:Utp14 protein-domain-containing protein [Gamsiella multidivaricata]|uniref:Utp14 protein-domain-containing protein n=1 Tax=Gamsiella multidivaricata TaxID=101098 RepID=UPI00221F2D49|nr:Utp14 protein-domain-containing protein [Gamsiella multidivaricata]KAG0364419.1 hypothetical protein BGZ54_007541 [Gamsiella multidivaricata]KAI7816385.1 Utp14 protein-domain-containing protein [Gamsiella multidivaricata]